MSFPSRPRSPLICLLLGRRRSVLVRASFGFQTLGVVACVLVLAGISHALVEPARRALDALFFSPEVQRLRSDLAGAVQDAGLTIDLNQVLEEAQKDLEAASDAHFVRLTEEALRRLNNPAALAQCELLTRLPETIASLAAMKGLGRAEALTPLQRAQLLRESLLAAIERLKPADGSGPLITPAVAQYEILHDEYLAGRPNKQIMIARRLGRTSGRNWREASVSTGKGSIKRGDAAARGDTGVNSLRARSYQSADFR